MSYSPYVDVIRNDYGYRMLFEIVDDNDDAINLSNVVEIELKVWRLGANSLEHSGVCSVVDSSLGTCYYAVPEDAFVNEGQFKAEIERSYADRIVTDIGLNITVWPDLPE